jgi:hypothetical protein
VASTVTHPLADGGRTDPGARRRDAGHFEVREIAFGDFPQVTRLNPGFVPGVKRLKVSLEVSGAGDAGGAAKIIGALAGFLPSLSFHRCCGDNSIGETFFDRDQRRRCSLRETDEGVDLAHLLEHVLIDVQHHIARMKICSGVTCAWIDPRDRYDIFVECLEEAVGRVAFGIAVEILEDLLAGMRPAPRHLCSIHVARIAHDHPGWPVATRLKPLVSKWGRNLVDEVVSSLHRSGYLQELPAAFNFSGRPLLCFLEKRSGAAPSS